LDWLLRDGDIDYMRLLQLLQLLWLLEDARLLHRDVFYILIPVE
jgi:hypothetical protein